MPAPAPGRRRWYRRARVIGPAGLILGVLIGSGSAGDSGSAVATAPSSPAPTITVTQTSAPSPAVTVTEQAPAPAPTTITITTTAEPAVEVPTAAEPLSEAPSSVYYANCSAARAAGAAPLRTGDPGYASHLDRDSDGVACE
ncbi:excalibur calcium-binding domain-containing protein [Kineococcus radiotolerans]|uniref:excalibur calcium-binding domain-containing protein n=1 Tax=Kineococcus radiotolerans TaxID=131568 RepID=UPI0021A5938A|nr:excalibur calcium-binding domain-containing protein [Kineococcus radiotolerans]